MSMRVVPLALWIAIESPGTLYRCWSLVSCATFRPVLTHALVVSNSAASPGYPSVSLAGKVSWNHCQMSTASSAGVPSTKASAALSR